MTAADAMSIPLLDAHLSPTSASCCETTRLGRPRAHARRWRTPASDGALEPPARSARSPQAGLLDRLFQHDDDGWRADVGAMELCLIREGLARDCTEAETAFAVQGLGSFPLLQSGRPTRSPPGSRGSRRARRSPASP